MLFNKLSVSRKDLKSYSHRDADKSDIPSHMFSAPQPRETIKQNFPNHRAVLVPARSTIMPVSRSLEVLYAFLYDLRLTAQSIKSLLS